MEQDTKEIVVNGESLLLDIQEAFSAFYPFLMIEFFQNEKSRLTNAKMDTGRRIKALVDMRAPHTIDINAQKPVSEVLHEFARLLSLSARISRKSGNVWNAISLTEGWTLERQNAAGEYISEIMGVRPVDHNSN